MSLSLLEELAILPENDREQVLASFDEDMLCLLATAWEATARPEQLPPVWPWEYWLLIGGRGSGKTRPSAELVHEWASEPIYIALVGETAAEVRDVMVEGPSGLLATARAENRCKYYPSKRRVVWKSGAWGTTFSGDEPDQLRGPNAHKAWVDELAKYKYPQETWDNLEMILRAGDYPQGIVSTTPRPLPLLKKLFADVRNEQHPTGHNALTRYTTYENWANLAPSFIARVVRRYERTRLGRQELHAEMLEDTPGALWTLALLEQTRVTATELPEFVRVGVALDPAATSEETSDEMGIVAGAKGVNGHGYTLRDASMRGTPTACARQAIFLYDELNADILVGEANNGGEWIGTVIALVAKDMYNCAERATPHINYKMVHASRGKQTRAEPVSALFERHLAHHVGIFADLEDQLTTWVPGMKSPDHLDAEVWLYTELMLGAGGPMQTRKFRV